MAFDPANWTYVLVTSTMYGHWLPGDSRGYVGEHNIYDTPYDSPSEPLHQFAKESMKESTVLFTQDHAETVLECWQNLINELEGWLIAVAIMSSHFHFVAVLRGKVTKATILRFFKGRAAWVLNQRFGKRTWWTKSGSVRYCFDEKAFHARIKYVKKQNHPLVLWVNPEFET